MWEKMWKKFEEKDIKTRLNAGYLVVIIFMVISGIVGILGLAILDIGLNDFVNGSNTADTAVKICRIDINIAARCVREAALNDDPGSITQYQAKVEEKLLEVGEQLEIIEQTGLIEDDLYQRYVDAISAWAATGYEILDMVEAGDRETAKEAILTECTPALDELIKLSQELDEVTNELMEQSVSRSKIIFIVGLACIVFFIVFAIISAVVIGKRIVRSIIEPLQQIETVALELTEGNLHSTMAYRSNDEIGRLAHDLRKAIRILGSYVDDIANAMGEFSRGNFIVQPTVEWRGDFVGILDAFKQFEESMADTVKDIQRVADQVESGATQVSESSTDLAQGATDQASITEELTATVETVSEQVAVNAETAKEISKKVEASSVAIEAGNEKMKEMVDSMGEINNASQEIRKIIDTINDIASQTNLLALNASIEAARAGEAGRGFAVVADQVSVLASQSADAAKESTVLIEASMKAVAKGIVIADETACQLEKVLTDSRRITEEVNKVADALEAQNDSFAQINAGVEHINDVVQTNSATSEECAAASQEMNSQATMLKEAIDRFKIK